MDKNNKCKVVYEKNDSTYMDGEGLTQTLYVYGNSNEYVFVAKQKGYIINALHIVSDEIEEFLNYWNQGMLSSTGHLKNEGKKF